MKKYSKSTVKRVFKYAKKHTPLLIVTILLAMLSVAVTIYVPMAIGDAIDCIVGRGNVDFDRIIKLIINIGVAIGIGALSQWGVSAISNRITFNMVKDIREDAFNKMTALPLSEIDKKAVGGFVSKVITDVETFSDGMLMTLTQLFTGVLTIVGTLVFMFMMNYIVALVVLFLTPISIFTAKFIAKRTYSMFKAQAEARENQTSYIDEIIGNQKVVKAFSYEERATEVFDEGNIELEKRSLKAIFFSSLPNPTTRVINNIVYAVVALIGALGVISGGTSVGILSCLLAYTNQYTKPFNEISSIVTELQNAMCSAERTFSLIDKEAEKPDKIDSVKLQNVEGRVAFNNVSFSYVKEKELLKNITLKVKDGERVAIVGPTGCGKTTLINLLMRFYEVDSGSITVDGADVRDMTRESLRENFGMVLQDTWLKSGTIRENIIMGKPDATEEEIVKAATESHAIGFIKRLPNGFDTQIGENGGILSQGQKQLLCITRVMLSLPPMLILDEATSSIDTRTEVKIQQAFSKMMENRTSFIVAHRLSTIQSADLILVMKDGNIIEQGKHEQLLQQGGFYSTLYNSQFS